MPDWKRRLLGLGLPCLLAFVFDVGMTLRGQPAEYWAGDYSRTTEGAPFFRKLFEFHPLAAVAGDCLWASIILIGILLLPELLAVILSIAVFGHAAGGYTWLVLMHERGWLQTLHGVLGIAAVILGLGLYCLMRTSRPVGYKPVAKHLHPVLRWGFARRRYRNCLLHVFDPAVVAVMLVIWRRASSLPSGY
jgi:hypothetical protein